MESHVSQKRYTWAPGAWWRRLNSRFTVALWIWVQPSLRDGVRLYLPDPALKRRAIVGSSLRDLVAFRLVLRND